MPCSKPKRTLILSRAYQKIIELMNIPKSNSNMKMKHYGKVRSKPWLVPNFAILCKVVMKSIFPSTWRRVGVSGWWVGATLKPLFSPISFLFYFVFLKLHSIEFLNKL